jgi:hypothetical protein
MVQITIESHKWQNIYYYSKYVHRCYRGFQPLGQYRQHIKVQKALNKYSTYLLCSLKLFLFMYCQYYMVQKYGVLVKIFNVLKKYNLDFASCY